MYAQSWNRGLTPAAPRSDEVISDERYGKRYHRYARERGTNRALTTRCAPALPAFLVWFRLARTGREYARLDGGMIVASNHRSFLDPFVIGVLLPWRRRMQFVAKVELFESGWQGWVLSRLGAFSIRRGQSDETAMRTAALIVERGGTVVIFPEGTRIRTGSLARPRRGVGRLALETGAVLPVAVHGSEQVRRGWRIRPRKVSLRAGKPITFPRTEKPSAALAATVTERIWPNIELQWEWLGGLPPAAQGGGDRRRGAGTALAVLLARAGSRSHSEPAARRRPSASASTAKRRLPAGGRATCGADGQALERDRAAGATWSASRSPRRRCRTWSERSPTGSARAPRCCCSKGFVQPMGRCRTSTSPSACARAIAAIGGPAHAREAVAGMALVLGSADADLRAMLGEVLDRAGLVCERTDDLAGVEVAGASKNAAALAAAAAERFGLNAAGIAAAGVARVRRVRPPARRPVETFSGLAGVET